ncbi:universal stress protein [Sphaerisporangium krabiense]|uniref:Nucleotide-binding universal stress UspA family protein n=1 Tax=Sphaerisporangium krabiense TaxID=763782 RepID=A0A7W8Z2A3_9ACTN|nr:universal stress protein [Sphaerisporangium krabiense]MBB5625843.1 nucleotide-binding universal stress UspA family protein [Sphaerisporangium krabiense]GII64647.1 universal stress protein [Sphaerisporangium krabiense]
MSGVVAVGIDDSVSAAKAADWATDEAARRNAALRIVRVREPWASEYPIGRVGGFEAALTDHCRGMLARAAQRAAARAPGVTAGTALPTGAVVERLLQESTTADLLVVGGRGMGGFAGLLLGAVGLGLAGRTVCPLVVVRGYTDDQTHVVAVGVDGSAGSEAALRHAFEEALLRRSAVRAVYAWTEPAFASLSGLFFEEKITAMRPWLAPWKEKYPDVQVSESVICRHPVPALVDASKEADLIVVGSRGRGAASSVVLGSVGHGILHRAHCPVMVVTSPGPR